MSFSVAKLLGYFSWEKDLKSMWTKAENELYLEVLALKNRYTCCKAFGMLTTHSAAILSFIHTGGQIIVKVIRVPSLSK